MGISASKRGGSMAEPNVVPMIDILLVLIIIFMVVTPLTPKGLSAIVPQPAPPDANPDPMNQRTVVVQVDCYDARCLTPTLKINEEEHSWETLGPRLQEIFKTRAEKVMFVKGGDELEFTHVARAIDIAKGEGIDKIGLMTAKIEAGE